MDGAMNRAEQKVKELQKSIKFFITWLFYGCMINSINTDQAKPAVLKPLYKGTEYETGTWYRENN